ncbi:hypothetical protein Tco_0458795 [Tanacetum coccineum]
MVLSATDGTKHESREHIVLPELGSDARSLVVVRTSIEDTISKFESLRRALFAGILILCSWERALAYESDDRGSIHVGSCSCSHRRYLPSPRWICSFKISTNTFFDRPHIRPTHVGQLNGSPHSFLVYVTPIRAAMRSPAIRASYSASLFVLVRMRPAPDPSTHDDPSVNKIHGSWSFTSLWGSTASVSGFSMRKSASICPFTAVRGL